MNNALPTTDAAATLLGILTALTLIVPDVAPEEMDARDRADAQDLWDAFWAAAPGSTVGGDAEEADDLAGAWRGAAQWLAGELGVEVEDTSRPDRASRTYLPDDADGAPVETLLWQAAHDLCRRDGSRPVGQRWTWDERPGVADGLRRALSPLLPAEAQD